MGIMPNEFIDNVMPNLSATGWKVFTYVWLKTNGSQGKADSITYDEITSATGIKGKATIRNAIVEIEPYLQVIPGRKRSNHNPGYVYLFCRPQDGAFKIGLSKHPKSRLNQIKESFPGTVMLHVIETDDMQDLENDLHQVFSDYRLDGEWFNLGDSDLEFLKQL